MRFVFKVDILNSFLKLEQRFSFCYNKCVHLGTPCFQKVYLYRQVIKIYFVFFTGVKICGTFMYFDRVVDICKTTVERFSEDSHIEMKMKENCIYLRKVRHVLFPEKYNGNNFIFLDGIHLE